MSNRSTTAVGLVVAILIVGAIASIGYYQFEIAPNQTTSSTSTSTTAVTCAKTNCAYVNITSGASSCTNPSSPCGFSPATITVVMNVNNTVVWTNNDAALHTVTPVTGATWGSPGLGLTQGQTYQYTFPAEGTYQYRCNYHPGMQGTVIVKGA